MPCSVVITKADVKAIRQRTNMVKVKAEMNKNPQYTSIDETRDAMCKAFLDGVLEPVECIIREEDAKMHSLI